MRYTERHELARYMAEQYHVAFPDETISSGLLAEWIEKFYQERQPDRLSYSTDFIANHLYLGLSDVVPRHRDRETPREEWEQLNVTMLLRDGDDTVSLEDFAREYLEPAVAALLRKYREDFGGWRSVDFLDTPGMPHVGTGSIGYLGFSNPSGVVVRGIEGYDGRLQGHTYSYSIFLKEATR